MRKTIYLKFILAYALFAFFGFVTVATFVSRLTYEYCQRQTSRNMYQEATRIADTYAADLYNSEISLETVQKQMESLSYFMDTEIWIINPSGRMIVNSADAPDPEQEIVVEGFDPTVTQKNYYTRGTFFDNNMLNISYLMLIVILFLSIIILIFFTEIVYRPLRKIIAATEQYAAGNMHYELNVEGDDEMGYLAASLGYMARTVASSEDDQKKFIANVSHDFRSPLTSIRGFLEAMQDGTIPPEMHHHYIGVVLNETERLTKLTNSLLALNNLNTKGMLLQMTDWDINDVIRKVSASFEQVCRSKNIRIRLILSGDVLYVHADMDKIQQVLYNLIDNAIKFSNYYSEIEIETTEKKGKVFVSVKDSGIGIPKEDQNQIWERFYKTDLSRGKDKKGTGLGLSIVREIIRAHGENISLVSTEGVGSKFTFTLKRSDLNDELDEEDTE